MKLLYCAEYTIRVVSSGKNGFLSRA